MGVDLLLVLFLQTEHDLDRDGTTLYRYLASLQFQGHLGGIFINMCGHVLAVDLLLGDSVLVDTQSGQHCASSRANFGTTITDHTDDNFLPSILAPGFAAGSRAHVLNVLEHTDHGAGEKEIVFIVHGDGDEKLRVSGFSKQSLAQGEAVLVEVQRIARRRGITHVGELVTSRGFSVGHLREQLGCDRTVENEVTVKQLHFLDRLPSPDGGRTGSRADRGVITIFIVVGIRTEGILRAKRVIRMLQDGHIVI